MHLLSVVQKEIVIHGTIGRFPVARQRDGATVSPVAWGQARSIGDVVVMMAAGAGGVKWVGVAGGVGR